MNKSLFVFLALVLVSSECLPQSVNRGEAIRLIAAQAKTQLDGRRADMETPDGSISSSTLEMLGMPDGRSGEVEQLNDGRYVISGCRPQSCAEKAIAVFSTSPSRLYALGFRHYHCRFVVQGEIEHGQIRPRARTAAPVKCDAEPSLSAYILRFTDDKIDPAREAYDLKTVRNWDGSDKVIREDVHVVNTP